MPTLTIEGEVNDMVNITDEAPTAPQFETISGPVNSVYGKVVQLMSVVTKVAKDKKNDFHHYSYASNVAVLSAVREEMVKLRLIYVPHFQIIDADTGDAIEVTALGAGSDKGDKHVQKGQTAADKYLWLKFLMLPTPDDPEADTATDARVAAPVSEPQSKGITGAVGRVTNAKVVEVRKKSESAKSPFLVITDKGEYQTFDTDIVTQMGLAQNTGLLVDFGYKETKWGKDIVKEKGPAA